MVKSAKGVYDQLIKDSAQAHHACGKGCELRDCMATYSIAPWQVCPLKWQDPDQQGTPFLPPTTF